MKQICGQGRCVQQVEWRKTEKTTSQITDRRQIIYLREGDAGSVGLKQKNKTKAEKQLVQAESLEFLLFSDFTFEMIKKRKIIFASMGMDLHSCWSSTCAEEWTVCITIQFFLLCGKICRSCRECGPSLIGLCVIDHTKKAQLLMCFIDKSLSNGTEKIHGLSACISVNMGKIMRSKWLSWRTKRKNLQLHVFSTTEL